jgi:hypothetical protein
MLLAWEGSSRLTAKDLDLGGGEAVISTSRSRSTSACSSAASTQHRLLTPFSTDSVPAAQSPTSEISPAFAANSCIRIPMPGGMIGVFLSWPILPPLQTRDRRRGSTYCVRLEFPFASGETAVSGWHSSRVFHLIAVQGHACSAAPAGNGHAPRRHARGPLSNARWHSRGSRGSISPCRKSSYDVIVPPRSPKSSPCRTRQGWWQIHSCS